MKLWLAVSLSIVIGIISGLTVGWGRMNWWYPWTGNIGGADAPVRISAISGGYQSADRLGLPKVVVDNDTYDFGVMDSHSTREHEFVLTNVGTGPLKLTKGGGGCKCTITKLDNEAIPPGASTKVVIQWTPKEPTEVFRQSADIMTNDPERPRVSLTIMGRVTSSAAFIPKELVFSRLSAGETARGTARLYTYLPGQSLEVVGHGFGEPKTEKFFEVAFRRLTAEQLKDEKDAQSGYEIQVCVKPGLPVGTFRQRISVKTNLKDAAVMELPIRGSVVSELSVSGRGYDEESATLSIAPTSSEEGAERVLQIIARGPHSKEVKIEPEEVFPANLLRVRVGQTRQMGGGTVSMTPVTIEIPKGSPPATFLGPEQEKLGRIMLKTHHPQSPELLIYVRFAIGG